MALPKLQSPIYSLTLPISGRTVNYRPYNLGDEKLLIAASSARTKDPEFFVANTLQVIRNCISDDGDIVDHLPAVDVEYLLMHLRARSVGETANVRILVDAETKRYEETEINLTEFYVTPRDKEDYVIKLTDQVGLKMRETSFSERARHAIKYNGSESVRTDLIYDLIADSVEMIYDGDEVFVIGTDATREELIEFLSSITNTVPLYKFIRNVPTLRLKVKVGKTEIEVTSNQVNFIASRSDTSI